MRSSPVRFVLSFKNTSPLERALLVVSIKCYIHTKKTAFAAKHGHMRFSLKFNPPTPPPPPVTPLYQALSDAAKAADKDAARRAEHPEKKPLAPPPPPKPVAVTAEDMKGDVDSGKATDLTTR